jgi:dsRNA-specific ribonuclease
MMIVQGFLYGSGTGASQSVAKEAAATQALEQMHQQYPGYSALF